MNLTRHSLLRPLQALILACGVWPVAARQPAAQAIVNAPQPVDWKVQARKLGLSETEIAFLGENRILMTRNCYKQIFDPYTGTDLPVFITTDAVLNAFHVLLESSFTGLERVQARRLRVFVQTIWDALPKAHSNLTGREQLVKAARRRATIVIAVALRLLGEPTPGLDPQLSTIVDDEVRKIESGTETKKPAWLGPPDAGFAGMDYARFRPRGFYVVSPPLERYFRALTWLQAIPFRPDRDEELLAHAMIQSAYANLSWFSGSDLPREKQIIEMINATSSLLPPGTFPMNAARPNSDWKSVDDLLKADRFAFPNKINDQVVNPELDSRVVLPEPSRRILSPRSMPESALFVATTDGRRLNRPFPNGLEVAGILGSKLAIELLSESEDSQVVKLVREQSVELSKRNMSAFLNRYINILATYIEQDPPYLANPAAKNIWKRKRLNSVLGSWAQWRHTFAAHATQAYVICNGASIEPGFVETAPRFFASLAGLATIALKLFEENDALFADQSDRAYELEQDALVADRIVAKGYENFVKEEFPNRDKWFPMMQRVRYSQWLANQILPTRKPEDWKVPDFWKDEPQRLRTAAAMMKAGKDPALAALRSKQGFKEWIDFIGICYRLEALLQKQLRNEAFDESERYFVKDFGRSLAGTMFYGGDAYANPRDDAPRIIDVFTNPQQGRLLVGVERPREILVFHTFAGKDYLCRGAVMPYCEFVGPKPMTDVEFMKLLDSPERPKPPAWQVPLFGPAGPRPPIPKKTH